MAFDPARILRRIAQVGVDLRARTGVGLLIIEARAGNVRERIREAYARGQCWAPDNLPVVMRDFRRPWPPVFDFTAPPDAWFIPAVTEIEFRVKRHQLIKMGGALEDGRFIWVKWRADDPPWPPELARDAHARVRRERKCPPRPEGEKPIMPRIIRAVPKPVAPPVPAPPAMKPPPRPDALTISQARPPRPPRLH